MDWINALSSKIVEYANIYWKKYFQAKGVASLRFKPLKMLHLLHYFVLYDNKLSELRIRQNKALVDVTLGHTKLWMEF